MEAQAAFFLAAVLLEHAHDVALLHDQQVLTVDLDLGAGPFAEQHPVADLEVDRDELAGLVAAARSNRDDLALGGLFLRGVGDDDAAGGLCLGIDALDDDAVVKRAEFHVCPPKYLVKFKIYSAADAGRPCRRDPSERDIGRCILPRKGSPEKI